MHRVDKVTVWDALDFILVEAQVGPKGRVVEALAWIALPVSHQVAIEAESSDGDLPPRRCRTSPSAA